jgi:hypothetical protein
MSVPPTRNRSQYDYPPREISTPSLSRSTAPRQWTTMPCSVSNPPESRRTRNLGDFQDSGSASSGISSGSSASSRRSHTTSTTSGSWQSVSEAFAPRPSRSNLTYDPPHSALRNLPEYESFDPEHADLFPASSLPKQLRHEDPLNPFRDDPAADIRDITGRNSINPALRGSPIQTPRSLTERASWDRDSSRGSGHTGSSTSVAVRPDDETDAQREKRKYKKLLSLATKQQKAQGRPLPGLQAIARLHATAGSLRPGGVVDRFEQLPARPRPEIRTPEEKDFDQRARARAQLRNLREESDEEYGSESEDRKY